MAYSWLRHLHITTVVFSISFFALRYYWMLFYPQMVNKRWARYLSMANDTLLLLAGISMAVLSHQYPFVAPWLTAKVVALLCYILLGTMALKRGASRKSRTVFGLLALFSVFYIVSVALTRSVTPWLTLIS